MSNALYEWPCRARRERVKFMKNGCVFGWFSLVYPSGISRSQLIQAIGMSGAESQGLSHILMSVLRVTISLGGWEQMDVERFQEKVKVESELFPVKQEKQGE